MQLLITYRKKNNLTQCELATKLGNLQTQSVSNWERGVAPIPVKHLPALMKVLGMPKEELISYYADRAAAIATRKLEHLS